MEDFNGGDGESNVIFPSNFGLSGETNNPDHYDRLIGEYLSFRSTEFDLSSEIVEDAGYLIDRLISSPAYAPNQVKFKMNLFAEELTQNFSLCDTQIQRIMVHFASLHADVLRILEKA